MSEQIARRMNLNPRQALEYKKRHDEIFPEFAQVSFKHVFLLP
jgi:L-rhamnose mutarotase